jgi:hypothetical protein
MSVRMIACAGPEGRQRVAHGVSRGIEEPSDYLSPGGAAPRLPRSSDFKLALMAKAGVQFYSGAQWIPAYAGMT